MLELAFLGLGPVISWSIYRFFALITFLVALSYHLSLADDLHKAPTMDKVGIWALCIGIAAALAAVWPLTLFFWSMNALQQQH